MFGPTKIAAVFVWLLAVVLFRLGWKLAVHRRRFRDLPKPPYSFLFGHIRLYSKVAKQLSPNSPVSVVFEAIRNKYNLPDVFYIDLWPLSIPFLVTGDLAITNHFLNDYTRHPLSLKTGLQPLAGGNRGLVSDSIHEWHSARATIRSVFSVTNVQRYVPDMARYSMQLREKLLEHVSTGRRFRLIDPIEQWGADLTFCFLLGDDTAVQNGGWGAELNSQVQKIIGYAEGPVATNPWTVRRRKKLKAAVLEAVRQKIRSALQDALRRDKTVQRHNFVCLVDSLADKYKEEFPGRTEWDDDTLIQHIDTMTTLFLAADVSSMVLTVESAQSPYVYCHIAQNPGVLTELRKEHDTVFPGDTQTTLKAIEQNPGKVKELPYTTAVIKESLRLRPPGISPTIAPKGHTVTYNGIEHNLEGFMLYPNLFHLQANKAYMSSPHTYDPTRWLPSPSSELADTWRPFQRGQHSCMGENMMTPGLVIALLLTVRDINVTLAYDEEDLELPQEHGGVAFMEGSFASKPNKGLPVTVCLARPLV
ncbi:hypothetical protein AJ79_08326 [Helicocarpus griseus UAMH5409]|uniref:Cytochrome P450 n=1 Tax=Helicocarpus griseus UAMH5409 TaxID=1447875 RepID=A0A2B7WTQ1_9EURO|nr:hypothetical protein AJ79_08326 [Helicocarpus griseus UAMH5409]